MENKICVECKHLNRELAFCRACGVGWLKETDGANCKYFEKKQPPTNGDRIRQMSNEELVDVFCYFDMRKCGFCLCEKYCTTGCCADALSAYLNAPAESEVKDEQ